MTQVGTFARYDRKRPFASKQRAKARALDRVAEPRDDAAGQIDAGARAEGQCKVAGEAAEKAEEQSTASRQAGSPPAPARRVISAGSSASGAGRRAADWPGTG